MKESDWRYAVDALLFICLIGMIFVGILLGLILSEGPVSSGGSKYFLGLHRHQWGDIHAYLSIAFVFLMAIHLVLSWKWIKAKTSQIFKRGATPALLVIGGLPVAVLFLFWIWTPRDSESFRSYGAGEGGRQVLSRGQPGQTSSYAEESFRHDNRWATHKVASPAVEPEHFQEEEYHTAVGSITITGRQTLRDLERATAVSAEEIVKGMGLPERTSLDETLGRLHRIHGFEIQEVRDLVARLMEERGNRRD